MTQISPAYPLTCNNLGTFHKVEPTPFCRITVVSMTGAAFLALLMAASLCGVRVIEVERQLEQAARI
ncbi:hypothetical protein RE411_04455 [Agrobacterium pusense]|uniref:hypothetical protein n=1 Tax=Agrobacterium pusense TaxID=648995 RepID=UPI002867C0BB|nr:hypothetical protein [Agrobacterium pusense]WMW56442.1 hypothetical protein RE411_04455 [Agrobacterium pusense]